MQNRTATSIKIMIVEDERIIAEEMAMYIRDLGYTVTKIVSRGDEAIRLAGEDRPDLIIMDIKLEGQVDGIKATKVIYSNWGIPVIYLTAFVDDQTINLAKETISYGYLVKPFSVGILKVTIAMALARAQMERNYFHINRVLQTIKNINQIIKTETDLDILSRKICDKLIEQGSYLHTWITLTCSIDKQLHYEHAGLRGDHAWLEECFTNTERPPCLQRAFKHNVIITNKREMCNNCMLNQCPEEAKCCTLQINNGLKIYGAIHVCIPADIPLNNEEISLLQELAGDIGFAVNAMEQEDERRRIERKEQLQKHQLIQASKMASLGILVSGIAHEINNPNNFIMLNTPVLQDIFTSLAPIISRFAEDNKGSLIGGVEMEDLNRQIPLLFSGITKGSERIKTIVDELKDFSRDEEIDRFDYINIEDIIKSVKILLANLIKKSTKHFIVDIEPLPSLRGNYQKLEQVFINLLQNGCQALENSEKAITITGRYLSQDKTIMLRIEDQGKGIPPENLPKIYDPFFTTKRDLGGTGLGLSISLQIIKQHDGDIQFSSLPGQGTTVTITFPLKETSKI